MLESVFSVFQTIVLIIFELPWFLLMILITELIPPTVDTDIGNYETYRQELNYASEFMPELDELREFDELKFGYQETTQFLFLSKTASLTVQYSPDDYLQAKESVMQAYDFLDAPFREQDDYYIASRTSNDYLLDDAFSYKGYNFRVVNYDGCKFFGMVGTNDDTCSIAYLYYSDTDRDYIAEEDEDLDQKMRALIDDEFCWEPFCE